MKAIIDGLLYNTKTATEIATSSHRVGSFDDYDETIFRTQKGRWFLAGTGGPLSRWAKPAGTNGWRDGSGIVALGNEEARDWLERHAEPDLVAQFFTVEEA